MITSASLGHDSGHVRFLLDGAVKTLSLPVTGAALHVVAGAPAYLVTEGKDVPNDYEVIELKQDQRVYTRPEPEGIEHPAAAEPVKGKAQKE